MYFHKKEGRNFECVCRKFLEVSRMTRKKKENQVFVLFVLFCFVFQERNLRALGGCLSTASTWCYSRDSSFLFSARVNKGLFATQRAALPTSCGRSTRRKKVLWLPRSCLASHQHAGAEQEKDLSDFNVWVSSSWVFDTELVRTLNVIWF